jgi:hypothetical protein
MLYNIVQAYLLTQTMGIMNQKAIYFLFTVITLPLTPTAHRSAARTHARTLAHTHAHTHARTLAHTHARTRTAATAHNHAAAIATARICNTLAPRRHACCTHTPAPAFTLPSHPAAPLASAPHTLALVRSTRAVPGHSGAKCQAGRDGDLLGEARPQDGGDRLDR